MTFKFILLTILMVLSSCSLVPPLTIEKTKEYLSQKDGMSKVVNHLAQENLINNKVTGMVVAVITPEGVNYFSYGYSDKKKETKMTTDTIFQVGSITKVFTASLLTILEDENYLDLKLPINHYIKDFHPRTKWVKDITPESMASHTSGLPSEYQDIKMLDNAFRFLWTGENIWKNLEEKELWHFIKNYNFGNLEKVRFRYSNVAYVFLGGLITRVVPNKSYEFLLQEKIIDPLKLTDTCFTLTPEQKERLATGYSGSAPPFMRRGKEMPPWIFHEGLNAAGGLYSTVHDLVHFLKLNMNNDETALSRQLKMTHRKIITTNKGHIGLGWFMETLPDSGAEQIYSNGIISGYTSYMGFDPVTKVGVVVLQNTMNMNYEFGEKFLDRLLLSRK